MLKGGGRDGVWRTDKSKPRQKKVLIKTGSWEKSRAGDPLKLPESGKQEVLGSEGRK